MPADTEAKVDLAGWVEAAQARPDDYAIRQVSEVVLTAIAATPELEEVVALKGGTLMSLVYESPRRTVDIDLTSVAPFAEDVGDRVVAMLNKAMPPAAIRLGYATLDCRVQTCHRRPNPRKQPEPDFPAFRMTIAFADRDTPAHAALVAGRCAQVLYLDISFNEPVREIRLLKLDPSGSAIQVYSLPDLIAEKLRAYLQQEVRRRERRQDIYDLAFLVETVMPADFDMTVLLSVLREKCRSRGLEPDADSLSQPALKERARANWDSFELELDEVPDFEERFAIVDAFYRSLPWDDGI